MDPRPTRLRQRLRLVQIALVLVATFAGGLVAAGVVSGAGALAALSSETTATDTAETTDTTGTTDTTTTDTTSTDPTDTQPTETSPTETTPTETTPTEPAALPCTPTGNESIATNKSDYAPGETVEMSGAGFAADCEVVMKVTRPDGSVVKGDGSFAPGSDVVRTSEAGNLTYDYILNGIVGDYLVEVLGESDAVLATTTFTDNIGLNDLTLYLEAARVTTRRVFERGDTVYARVQDVNDARFYKLAVLRPDSTVAQESACIDPSSGATTLDDAFVIGAAEPLSTSTRWTYRVREWTTSATCSTSSFFSGISTTFNVAQAFAFANATDAANCSTAPCVGAVTDVASSSIVYFRVLGFFEDDAANNDLNITFFKPGGAACANTSGFDRPDADGSGRVPTSSATAAQRFLRYPPLLNDATAGAWNNGTSYDGGTTVLNPCPASTDSDAGLWEIQVGRSNGTATTQSERTVRLDAFNVIAPDTTAPSVDCGSDIAAEATGPGGANVSWGTDASKCTATDSVGVTSGPTCTPVSGSSFPIGTTTVTCEASDAAGNTGSDTFEVIVQDTTDPLVTCGPDITAEATGPSGAVVTWNAGQCTASDLVDAGVTNCTEDYVSGSTFGLGTTTVTCNATDSSGNSGAATFSVTVQDTTAPTVTCGAGITVEATGPSGAVVSWGSGQCTASDVVDAGVTDCAESSTSGATFPLGTSTITCSVTDASGNTGSDSFTVTVRDTTAPAVTIATVSDTVLSPSETTTEITWSATDIVSATGTYVVKRGTCATGTAVSSGTNLSGAYTFGTNVATTVNAGALGYGSNTVTVCVTDGSGNTGSDNKTINRQTPTTLTYSGDTYKVGSPPVSISLAGTLADAQTACNVMSKTIDYYVDLTFDGDFGDAGEYIGSTATSGGSSNSSTASRTKSLAEGIYALKVEFDGTNECAASSDEAVVTVVTPGDAANGGGWYKVDAVQGSPRVNFGFTVRRVPNTTDQYKGQLLWHNNGKWRLKGTMDGTNTFGKFTPGCPSGHVCGSTKGNGTLYAWVDPTPLAPTSGDEYWGNPQSVTFTATFYDGGSAKKGGALKPDWFGMQINGISGPTLPESAPIQMKGGNVTIA